MANQLRLSKEGQGFFGRLAAKLGRVKLYQSIVRFFNREGLKIAAKIKKESFGKATGGDLSIGRVARRTGALSRSIHGRGEMVGGHPAIRVGTLRGPSIKYAAVQEYGTKGADPTSPIPTIKPKKGKSLAMPLNSSLYPSGVPRYDGPRNDPRNLTFIPFRRGIAVGALYDDREIKKIDAATERSERTGALPSFEQFKAAYVLLRQVDIRPKRFLRNGFKNYMPTLLKNLTAHLRELLFGKEGLAR